MGSGLCRMCEVCLVAMEGAEGEGDTFIDKKEQEHRKRNIINEPIFITNDTQCRCFRFQQNVLFVGRRSFPEKQIVECHLTSSP